MSNSVDPRTVTVGERRSAFRTSTAAQIEPTQSVSAPSCCHDRQLTRACSPPLLAQEAKERPLRALSPSRKPRLWTFTPSAATRSAIKKVAVVALSTVGAIGALVLLATRAAPRTPSGSPHQPRGRWADSPRSRGRRGRRPTRPPSVCPRPGIPLVRGDCASAPYRSIRTAHDAARRTCFRRVAGDSPPSSQSALRAKPIRDTLLH